MKTRTLLLLAFCLIAACTLPHNRTNIKVPEPTLRLTLLPQSALVPGQPTTVLVKLNDIKQRSLLTDADLQPVEGEKLRLLVIDPLLSDYQHLHPKPTATPGIFSVSFTPKATHGYHVWADVTPVGGAQEFVLAELGPAKRGAIDSSERNKITINGYHFDLSFNEKPERGDEVTGTIRVTDAGGNPVGGLSGTHVVGAYGDYRHLQYAEPLPGDNLAFRMTPYKEGFMRLFARMTIGLKEFVVPFGVKINKAS